MSGRPLDDTERADASAGLIRFVRETLGCGCPDEVLAEIALDVSETGEPGLDVGGRLLVRVLPAGDVGRLIDDFPDTVERLVGERDRRGFRRLRLVVCAAQPAILGEVLDGILDRIVAADQSVNLHVLEYDQLPFMLTGGG